MEFNFNINKLLPKKINKISQSLMLEEFRGDRREFAECQKQLTRVLDDMGEASAKAQGLSKTITSAQKLRDTDHLVYLLVDSEANQGKGSVVGLLKTGSKNLFMFDETGLHYQLQPRCVLDFYVHESRQRTGCGNLLYQHMLAEEKITPLKLAIDRPSEKLLAFLRKHYGLTRIIPQNNKFVVFHGFFDDEVQDTRISRYGLSPGKAFDSPSPNNNSNDSSVNGSASRSSYGRYAAARPVCSMGNIIHNTAVLGQPAERTGSVFSPSFSAPKPERPRSLSLYSEEEQKQRTTEISTVPTPALPEHQPTPFVPIMLEAERAERERNASVKTSPSPSCAQEVGGSEAAHLDLKFYHSPLW
ncbi:alpha-tubulin N-acetyltransferase 1 isoform X1 [Neodiprion lecontei]|uniref:Alpha-tubulin N-acetyltransferase n=1 Tax=Neodiprion lecontei TaxID=441921 RepID=A0A6J0BU29_NEOLC|nr:alpha-tubulin N-acetyltransferase 1 isoform X1 [Neodiprion lecontei]XP_046589019.1 alpha-tubulin N-acetyltransferase 1 isoform X1 [Neodiprion lecontei]